MTEIIRLTSDTPFTAATPVAEPIGLQVAQTRTALHRELSDTQAATGIWECTPGSWRRQVLLAEYSYIISGNGRFTTDEGEPVEFQAGDAIYFPANTSGTWEIRETVRKTYLLLG